MKKNQLSLYCLIALWLFSACKDEDRYETSIIRDREIFLNGDRWTTSNPATDRPVFIYDTDGKYKANYTSAYNFVLDNGTYRFFAAANSGVHIPDSIRGFNLDDLVIPQAPAANVDLVISPVLNYSSPFDEGIKLYMATQTGMLRLVAKDLTPDPGYSQVRAVVGVSRSAYRVGDASFVESSMELTRSKATSTGGVNYTDDFVVFETGGAQQVSVRFELLDNNGQVVRTKQLETKFEILPNEVTIAEFYLNE